jgi:pimeloyl-ACP methyl ester carboxylesterase
MLRTARFLRTYLRHPSPAVAEEEWEIPTEGGDIPCTVYRPRWGESHSGWVVLHGITVPGRAHPVLQRFARALCGAGGVVMVPEIGEWRKLRVNPEAADRVIVAATRRLAGAPGVHPGGVGLVGFSFGATQALQTAARAEVAASIRSVVAFGGYCDPWRTFHFAFTGEHEWRGVRRRLTPDPYGRWIVTANYLREVPELLGCERVAHRAQRLAEASGARRIYAGDPSYDLQKAQLRAELSKDEREIWDLVAPPSDQPAPVERAGWLAKLLTDAAVKKHPALDPRATLPRLNRRVVLAHGYYDHLVPYTETLRLQAALPPAARAYVAISRLFAHSEQAPPLRLPRFAVEAARYVRLLNRALAPS